MKYIVAYENGHPDGSVAQAHFDHEHDAQSFARLYESAEIAEIVDGEFDMETGYFSGTLKPVRIKKWEET